MSTSRKSIFAVFGKAQAPMAERAVRYPQIARDLGLRFSARLPQMHGFQFKFLRVRWSCFLHDLDPFWGRLLFPCYLLHSSGSRPGITDFSAQPQGLMPRAAVSLLMRRPEK